MKKTPLAEKEARGDPVAFTERVSVVTSAGRDPYVEHIQTKRRSQRAHAFQKDPSAK